MAKSSRKAKTSKAKKPVVKAKVRPTWDDFWEGNRSRNVYIHNLLEDSQLSIQVGSLYDKHCFFLSIPPKGFVAVTGNEAKLLKVCGDLHTLYVKVQPETKQPYIEFATAKEYEEYVRLLPTEEGKGAGSGESAHKSTLRCSDCEVDLADKDNVVRAALSVMDIPERVRKMNRAETKRFCADFEWKLTCLVRDWLDSKKDGILGRNKRERQKALDSLTRAWLDMGLLSGTP